MLQVAQPFPVAVLNRDESPAINRKYSVQEGKIIYLFVNKKVHRYRLSQIIKTLEQYISEGITARKGKTSQPDLILPTLSEEQSERKAIVKKVFEKMRNAGQLTDITEQLKKQKTIQNTFNAAKKETSSQKNNQAVN